MERIIVKKRTVILIALMTLALDLIGTGLSTIYEHDEFIPTQNQLTGTVKVSYGFPLAWHGYSYFVIPIPFLAPPSPEYWFSLGSLVLDVAFWFAMSFVTSVATMESVKILLKTIASKVVVTYFIASATFSIVGSCLYLFGYEDLGLRLYAFGMFLVAATFYQSLVGKKKKVLEKAYLT